MEFVLANGMGAVSRYLKL